MPTKELGNNSSISAMDVSKVKVDATKNIGGFRLVKPSYFKYI